MLWPSRSGWMDSKATSWAPSPTPGRGRSSTESIQLKTVVLAAMPSARVRTATMVNAGLPFRIRMPYRRSCQRVRMTFSARGGWARALPHASVSFHWCRGSTGCRWWDFVSRIRTLGRARLLAGLAEAPGAEDARSAVGDLVARQAFELKPDQHVIRAGLIHVSALLQLVRGEVEVLGGRAIADGEHAARGGGDGSGEAVPEYVQSGIGAFDMKRQLDGRTVFGNLRRGDGCRLLRGLPVRTDDDEVHADEHDGQGDHYGQNPAALAVGSGLLGRLGLLVPEVRRIRLNGLPFAVGGRRGGSLRRGLGLDLAGGLKPGKPLRFRFHLRLDLDLGLGLDLDLGARLGRRAHDDDGLGAGRWLGRRRRFDFGRHDGVGLGFRFGRLRFGLLRRGRLPDSRHETGRLSGPGAGLRAEIGRDAGLNGGRDLRLDPGGKSRWRGRPGRRRRLRLNTGGRGEQRPRDGRRSDWGSALGWRRGRPSDGRRLNRRGACLDAGRRREQGPRGRRWRGRRGVHGWAPGGGGGGGPGWAFGAPGGGPGR